MAFPLEEFPIHVLDHDVQAEEFAVAAKDDVLRGGCRDAHALERGRGEDLAHVRRARSGLVVAAVEVHLLHFSSLAVAPVHAELRAVKVKLELALRPVLAPALAPHVRRRVLPAPPGSPATDGDFVVETELSAFIRRAVVRKHQETLDRIVPHGVSLVLGGVHEPVHRGQGRLVRDGRQVHHGRVHSPLRLYVDEAFKRKFCSRRGCFHAVSDHLTGAREVSRGYVAGPGGNFRVGNASHVRHAFLSEHGDVMDPGGDGVCVVEGEEVRVVLWQVFASEGDIGVDAEVLARPRLL